MNYAQQARIDKVFNEKIFLIDLNKGTFDYFIKICGTTKNIYNLKLSHSGYNKGKLTCDCPDGRKIAKSRLFCKHSCFVLCKLLKTIYPTFKETIFSILVFTDEQIKLICEEFGKFSIETNQDLIDNELITKYNNYVEPNFNLEKYDKNELCPICFDIYDDKHILGCPTCNKGFHKECIDIWLETSIEKSCPYCRSVIWKILDNPNNSSNYINLS
jgi:hypothetical protein